jgi:hypothetical protein
LNTFRWVKRNGGPANFPGLFSPKRLPNTWRGFTSLLALSLVLRFDSAAPTMNRAQNG